MKNVDESKISSIESMFGEDDEETRQFRVLYDKAVKFITAFAWHGKIERAYFGLGAADIVGVFLFELIPASASVDRFLWVVIGDLPPAYLVTDDTPNPACALDAYIREMRKWLEAVKLGEPTADLVPVNAPPTVENANDLENRLEFLEKEILGNYRGDLAEGKSTA